MIRRTGEAVWVDPIVIWFIIFLVARVVHQEGIGGRGLSDDNPIHRVSLMVQTGDVAIAFMMKET